MKKPVAALAAIMLSGGAVFGFAGVANADDSVPTDTPTVVSTVDAPVTPAPEEAPAADPAPAPVVDPAPAPVEDTVVTPVVAPLVTRIAQKTQVDNDYVTVAWKMASYIDATHSDFSVDQVFQIESSSTDDPDLTALDSWVSEQKCGLAFQIDVYVDDAITTSLVAGGVLHGPNDPSEHLAPGGWGSAYKVVYTGDCTPPPPPTVQPCSISSSVVTTDLSTWYLGETRANGHNVLVPNALHIYTDDNSSLAKAAGYYGTDFKLKDLGDQTIADSIDYTATTGITPGLQLSVDLDNDGTADGFLVGEAIYGNDWWLSNGTPAGFTAPETGGGFGSNRHGTINEWLTLYPDANVKAIGYSLGSGVLGDGLLNRISLGCVDYTFNALAPPAETRQTVVTTEPDCTTQTTTTTTTNYETPYIWDSETGTFVPGEEHQVGDAVVTTNETNSEQCATPTLEGTVASGVCIANAPWINYDVNVTNPDGVPLSGHDVTLTMTDGTNTTIIPLGTIVGENGEITGKVLWPGASVAADGVTPTGWPGWTQDADGTWVTTTGNFAWTRTITEATIEVNPSLVVSLSYPPATPDCDANPHNPPPPTTPAILAHTGVDMAATGWSFGIALAAIIAGLIAVAAIAFRRQRRSH